MTSCRSAAIASSLLARLPRGEVRVGLERGGVLRIGARDDAVGGARAVLVAEHVAVEIAERAPQRDACLREVGRLREPLDHPDVRLLQIRPALRLREDLLDLRERLDEARVAIERLLELRHGGGLVLHLVLQHVGERRVQPRGAHRIGLDLRARQDLREHVGRLLPLARLPVEAEQRLGDRERGRIEPRRREERVDRLVRVPEAVAAGLADRDEVRELRVALEDRQEPLPLLDGALDVARRLQDRDEAAA